MGILACLIGAFTFSAKDVVSKLLSVKVDGTSSTFASFAFAVPYYALVILIAWQLGVEDFMVGPQFATLVIFRALTDSGAEWFKMQALASGEISLLVSFLYLSPVFVLFLAPIMTGDVMTWQGMVGVCIVSSAGVFLAIRERKVIGQHSMRGITLALCSAFFFSLNHCLDRLAVKQGSPLLCGFSMTLVAALFFAPFVLQRGRAKAISENSGNFLIRGLFEILSMFCKLFALQYMQAAYVVGILRISMVFSIISGKVVFKEKDFGARMVAGAITLVGVLLIVFAG